MRQKKKVRRLANPQETVGSIQPFLIRILEDSFFISKKKGFEKHRQPMDIRDPQRLYAKSLRKKKRYERRETERVSIR